MEINIALEKNEGYMPSSLGGRLSRLNLAELTRIHHLVSLLPIHFSHLKNLITVLAILQYNIVDAFPVLYVEYIAIYVALIFPLILPHKVL